jgi:hypothetical protein
MKTRSTFFSLLVMLVMLTSMVFQVTPAYASNPSIVVNGDFTIGGISGFTTEYIENCASLQLEGRLCVSVNPHNQHVGFTSMGDHTTGSGNMLVVNGDVIPGQYVWQQTVTGLVSGRSYDFSAWGANVVSSAPAILSFVVDGTTIASLTPTGNGTWQRFSGNFTATGTSVILRLDNAQTIANGNDFAIDDINIFVGGTHTPPSAGATPSSVNMVESSDPAVVNQPVTYTATVTPAGVTGNVDWYEGDTYLGSSVLDGAGQTTYDHTWTSTGTKRIQAEYQGNDTYQVSYDWEETEVITCFAPVVSSVSIIAGPIAGGMALSINGDHFNDAGCTVTSAAFGGTNGTSFAVVDNTHINVTTPAHALGTVNVTVTGLGGTGTLTGSLAGGFTFVPPPAVEGGVKNTGTYPRLGPWTGGTSVEVTGTYFTGLGTGNATFTFGGVPASCTVTSDTSATCITPAGAAGGLVHVVATTPVGGTGAVVGDFYYVALNPIIGPTAGGQTVTITGVGFTGATVYFNGLYSARAACTVTSDFLLTCVTPARPVGLTDVVITTVADGNVFLLDGYTYAPAPSIDCCGKDGCSPNTGSPLGGETVLINGDNLTGGTFTFDGIPAVCTVNLAGTQASCITPAHAPGLVDVVVTTIGGTANVGFTYGPYMYYLPLAKFFSN